LRLRPRRTVDAAVAATITSSTGSSVSPLSRDRAVRRPAVQQRRCRPLSKWLVRELGEEQADPVIAFTQKCVVVPLDTTIALLAAQLHRDHKLATADAIVYATARHLGAELLTCDAHFRGLPDVALFPRTMD